MTHPSKRFRLLIAISLISGTAVAMSASAYAVDKPASKSAKTEKSQTKTATVTKSRSVSPKKEKPVLDDTTLKSIETASAKLDLKTRKNMNLLADTLQEQDKAIYNEIRDEEELSMANIGMLWEAAVERSGTIRYAIEKLSRRDATGKPVEGDNFSKRMLGNLVHLGGVAGSMWTGTPAGLIGSNMIQDIMTGTPQDPTTTRVTDADMVILAKEVEELQSNLITLYYNYKHAKEKLALAEEAQRTINKHCDYAAAETNPQTEALKPLMQSLVESAHQDVLNAQQNLASSRSALSGVVGPAAVAALDESHKDKKAAL